MSPGEERTQMEIAHSAGVSEVTVRNRYIDLISKLKLNIMMIF
jgi:transcription initiation factor TFIIIB Brf1 subunit/transcription initiation factor TFIIB